MKIKVCGTRHINNINNLSRLDIDYLGFIFYPQSPRYAAPHLQLNDAHKLSNDITKIGVFVNEKIETILSYIDQYGLQGAQLHGNETASMCDKLKKLGHKVFKVIHIQHNQPKQRLQDYEDVVDALLLDSKVGNKLGGTGQSFNWSILDRLNITTPFFLSGGINLSMADAINTIQHPYLYGVDINSGFETQPGIKDIELIEKFIKKIKA